MKHAAWYDGFDAQQDGLDIGENPECPGQPAFWAWRDGWAAAAAGHPELPRPKPAAPLPERN